MNKTDTPTISSDENIYQEDKQASKAAFIIKKYSLVAGGAFLIPYDGVAIVSSTIIQTLMVRKMCELYGVKYSDRLFNVIIWSTAGGLLIKLITELIHNAVPSIQSNQKIDFTGAAISGIYTATLGEFFRLHLQDGGTLEDVSASDFVDYFVTEVQQGNLSIDSFTNPRQLINQFVLS